MMNIFNFAHQVVSRGELSCKIDHVSIDDFSIPKEFSAGTDIKVLAREEKIQFSKKRISFPKRPQFHSPDVRAKALHFFANHELLAIECFAHAILKFPVSGSEGDALRLSLYETICDEQKHLRLYINRMKLLGLEFGENPLSDFFWRYFKEIESIDSFYALMGLTFESANLDFCQYYQDIFNEFEDKESEQILKIVYKDEVDHVGRAHAWLSSSKKDTSLWDYYSSCLPDKISPDRAKGHIFDAKGRLAAGLPADFVDKIELFESNYEKTKRKEWNNSI